MCDQHTKEQHLNTNRNPVRSQVRAADIKQPASSHLCHHHFFIDQSTSCVNEKRLTPSLRKLCKTRLPAPSPEWKSNLATPIALPDPCPVPFPQRKSNLATSIAPPTHTKLSWVSANPWQPTETYIMTATMNIKPDLSWMAHVVRIS